MRNAVVGLVSGIAAACAACVFALYRIRVVRFVTASRLLALPPGAFGIRLRRYWYRMTLAACGSNLVVEWLTAFKTPEARVGSNVFVGAMCWIAEASLGDDVMIGARAAIQGGAHTHTFERVDLPINRQPQAAATVTIGADVWIGTGATVMADVSPGTVVGAGAVVTRSFPPRSVIAGVPAQFVRERGSVDIAHR